MNKQDILERITKRNVALVVLLLIVFSFVFERLTLPNTTTDMERRALEYGEIHEKEKPPKPFFYDGCTFFVDSLITNDFTEACLTHDIAYWYGGTPEERKQADKLLAEDLKHSGVYGTIVVYPAYYAVRLFGDSFVTKSVDAHWGFGWE